MTKAVAVFALALAAFALQQAQAVDFSKLRDRSMLFPRLRQMGSNNNNNNKNNNRYRGDQRDRNRIVDGGLASRDYYKSIVAIFIDEEYFCGGNIIGDRWILTAAHCVDGARQFEVRAGEYDLNNKDPHEVTKTSWNYIVHNQWNPDTLKADIALIKIDQLSFNNYISAVTLVQREPTVTTSTRTVGWGRTSDSSDSLSQFLRNAQGFIVSDFEAQQEYGYDIDFADFVCVDTYYYGGPCNGDSGGPLYYVNRVNELIGVTSFVHADGCNAGHPACFSSVAVFRAWIEQHTSDAARAAKASLVMLMVAVAAVMWA